MAFTASVPRPEALSTNRPAPEPSACARRRAGSFPCEPMKHGLHVRVLRMQGLCRAHAPGLAGFTAVRAAHYLARAELRRAVQLHCVVRGKEGALLQQDVAARVQLDELDVARLRRAERGVAVVRRRDSLHEEGLAWLGFWVRLRLRVRVRFGFRARARVRVRVRVRVCTKRDSPPKIARRRPASRPASRAAPSCMCSDIVTSASCRRCAHSRGGYRATCTSSSGWLPCVRACERYERTHRLSLNSFATSELHHHGGGGAGPGDRKGHATHRCDTRQAGVRSLPQVRFANTKNLCTGGIRYEINF